jgi:hypothetical protein
VDPNGRKDTVYWLQSLGWKDAAARQTTINVVQTAVATGRFQISLTLFASRAQITDTLTKAEETDIVIIQSHSSRAGMREASFFGGDSLLTSNDIATALNVDESRPDALILSGCSTDRVAQAVAEQTGVPSIGTTAGVGLGVGAAATGEIVESLVNGATPQAAADAGNQILEERPVHCAPDPCNGEFSAFELTATLPPPP